MFDECGIMLSRHTEFFSNTDSFGQSLVAEILEPMTMEYIFLSQLAEELDADLAKIDAALEEIRAMGG
jgi:hypothetical protein